MTKRRAGAAGALGAAVALLLAAAAGTAGGGEPAGQDGSAVGASAAPATVNRLDSNLLDDPSRSIGPTVAAVAAIEGSNSGSGSSGSDGERENGQEPAVSRGSRFRVVS